MNIRSTPVILAIAALAACKGAKDAAVDSASATATAMAPAAAPAAKTPKDFAGTWQTTATLEGVAAPVPSTLVGSDDGATWTLSLEGRPNVPATASVSGDSLVIQTAEYESVLRKGVMVTVRTASVMSDPNMLMGNMISTYKTPKGEEVVKGTVMSMRAPK
jgi:hypothetical protein